MSQIYCIAVDPDSTRFGRTKSALYAFSPNNMKSLINDHQTETGFADGEGNKAFFNCPQGITVDSELRGVARGQPPLIKVTLRCGTVATLAGNWEAGYTDGAGATAHFNKP